MEALDGVIRPYAWGSHTAIARIQGRPAPTDEPQAELWFGAHPDSPSTVDDRGPLDAAVAADPDGMLGPDAVARFGVRLPFLMKVLAAAQPLSLQAHPDAAQARAGYAAEESAGVPRDAPGRNYRDPYHKPEILVAVEEFDALCGFRDPASAADELARLGVPALKSTVDSLRSADPARGLHDAVAGLLTLPVEERAPLVDAVIAAPGAPSLAVDLAERYPGDVGVVVALLLNRVRLRPGEAVWMPAGNLHAYLRGTGVEVMAASDNVLRGGLTPKHVDVPELLRLLRFEVLADPVVRPRPAGPHLVSWPVPAEEFTLHRAIVSGDGLDLPGRGARIVLCLSGDVRVDDGVAKVTLSGGRAAFGPAGRTARVSGTGVVFQAAVPLAAR